MLRRAQWSRYRGHVRRARTVRTGLEAHVFWFGKKKPPVEPHHDLEEAVDLSAPPNRNAMILIGLGGATITGFGLAATQGVVAPIFLALVLTICVHPLRIALERRGVPRGIATVSVVLAVFILLAAFVT